MTNPFMIDPNMGRSKGQNEIAGLGNVLRENRERKEAKAVGSEFAEVMKGDFAGVKDFLGRNPEYTNMATQQFGITNDRTKALTDELTTGLALAKTPEEGAALIDQYLKPMTDAGGMPINLANAAIGLKNGTQDLETVKNMAMVLNPSLQKSMGEVEKKSYKMGAGDMSGYVFDPSTGEFSIDPKVKEQMTDKAESAAATEGKLDAKTIQGINKDVTSLTKDARGINSAAKSLAKLKQSSSPSSQLAAIFKFMKALDPTSVVREGEQQMAKSTGGPADYLVGVVSQLQGEGGLPPGVFADMVETSKALSDSAVNSINGEMTEYLRTYGDTMSDTLKDRFLARTPKLFTPAGTKKAIRSPGAGSENYSNMWGD